ncbi:2-C-methyl-D-erythritol 4-phosphate cytidylyltransferase [Oxalicibacterium faecigallinarum]|uniref:2-C-methyl-D-erythritol 4-phosphate cytidylyltransferase n=1 Tax=Oxalicibacterium faecigallinarum TaxID=573741 RepID=A0A8J3F0T3_9BURK|nr:2-C-methyl-D-erythritol 4-phosphate cytidylyltransferase [Oxalicibacterium faecigallinarum]GGI16294.1 2-C-methyl-D-erythritol 4-phosphate cytidylyltransferase [Oxalicibacterium faecigallinarum]
MTSARYFGLIPAAGIGARMGAAIPKQYAELAGKPMLMHVLETFTQTPLIAHTFVVVSPEDGYIDGTLATAGMQDHAGLSVLRVGGATRHDSVLHGLRTMRAQVNDDDWILVHDAARPGLQSSLIRHLIAAINDDEVGGLLAVPVVDTLKRADAHHRAEQTVPREQLWAAQTPQMFRYGLLRRALEQDINVTDEASAVESLGLKPKLVEGNTRNFKVTLPHDVALAEIYLRGQA